MCPLHKNSSSLVISFIIIYIILACFKPAETQTGNKCRTVIAYLHEKACVWRKISICDEECA
jgi:hypothetical protein